jgi:hypothetical protein
VWARRFVKGGLSRQSGALEFVAEVLKVFLSDLQLQDFFDHGREVCQRADRSQRRGAGGPDEAPGRSQYEGVLNCVQRHTALVQLGCQHSIRPADDAASAGSRTIGIQKPADIVALLHRFSPAARAMKDR